MFGWVVLDIVLVMLYVPLCAWFCVWCAGFGGFGLC